MEGSTFHRLLISGGADSPWQGLKSVSGVGPEDTEADGQRHQEPGDRPQELRENRPGQGRQVRGVYGKLREGREGSVFYSAGKFETDDRCIESMNFKWQWQAMATKMETLYADLAEYLVFDKQKYTLEEFFTDIKTFKDAFKLVSVLFFPSVLSLNELL